MLKPKKKVKKPLASMAPGKRIVKSPPVGRLKAVKKPARKGRLVKLHPSLAACQLIMDRKSKVYNGTVAADPARPEYFWYGDESYLQMIRTKIQRVEQVRLRNEGKPDFESARDSVLDAINYLAFYASYLEKLDADSK